MRAYEYTSDPGHGWVRVPTEELLRLGLVDMISSCSYISRDFGFAYLEEDDDMALWYRAYTERHGKPPELRERSVERTMIRDLPAYTPERARCRHSG